MIKRLILTALLTFSGPAYADFASGNDASESGDFKKALEIWIPLAKNGDAPAAIRPFSCLGDFVQPKAC